MCYDIFEHATLVTFQNIYNINIVQHILQNGNNIEILPNPYTYIYIRSYCLVMRLFNCICTFGHTYLLLLFNFMFTLDNI